MIDLLRLTPLPAIYQLYHDDSFRGGRSRSTRREPPTMGKQLVNFIICGCDSVHPFCNLQSRVQTHAILVIGLYELLGNPTTQLIEHGPCHILGKGCIYYVGVQYMTIKNIIQYG